MTRKPSRMAVERVADHASRKDITEMRRGSTVDRLTASFEFVG